MSRIIPKSVDSESEMGTSTTTAHEHAEPDLIAICNTPDIERNRTQIPVLRTLIGYGGSRSTGFRDILIAAGMALLG